MAQHKIVFISHAIRGIKDSDERRFDLPLLLKIMEEMRTQRIRSASDIYPAAPYLLHAQTLASYEELASYRKAYARDPVLHGGVLHDELHLYGEVLLPEMRFEAQQAKMRGIPVVIKSEALRGMLPFSLASADIAA